MVLAATSLPGPPAFLSLVAGQRQPSSAMPSTGLNLGSDRPAYVATAGGRSTRLPLHSRSKISCSPTSQRLQLHITRLRLGAVKVANSHQLATHALENGDGAECFASVGFYECRAVWRPSLLPTHSILRPNGPHCVPVISAHAPKRGVPTATKIHARTGILHTC